MKILIYDSTRQANLLDESWAIGAFIARTRRRFDEKIGASSWPDALQKLLKVSEGKKIEELHYWGHGDWGKIYIGDKAINDAVFNPLHPWYAQLKKLAGRLTESSIVWFRVCCPFGNDKGQRFAVALSEFMKCRCIGSTYIIHLIHGGVHSILPGQKPHWPVKEGVVIKDNKEIAMKSSFSSPHWIMFWRSTIPPTW